MKTWMKKMDQCKTKKNYFTFIRGPSPPHFESTEGHLPPPGLFKKLGIKNGDRVKIEDDNDDWSPHHPFTLSVNLFTKRGDGLHSVSDSREGLVIGWLGSQLA